MTFATVLKKFGFKRAQWNKCPQGFEKAGYPCYSHTNGSWCELYLSDQWPYGRISSDGLKAPDYHGGNFFESSDQLNELLKQIFP